MPVSRLLYMGALALFVAGTITEIVERRAAATWQEAVTLDGKGPSSSQSSAPQQPSSQTKQD